MNAPRGLGGRARRAHEGRGRGFAAASLALAVCLVAGPAHAGVWTQLGSLPIPNLTAVARTDSGTVLVATFVQGAPDSSDVWEYDGLTLEKLSTRYAPRPIFGLIRSLATAPNGDIWVGCDNGAFRLRPQGFTRFSKDDGIGSRLVDIVKDIVVAPDGTVWAATGGGGLSRFDGSTWTSLRNPEDGLPSNDVEGLALAPDGTLWIALHNIPFGPGLARYKNGVITPGPATPADLSKVMVASDGHVWAVSPNSGVFVFDAAGNLVAQHQSPAISNDLTSIVEGPHGDVWVGSFSTGVYRWNGGTWERFSAALNSGLTNDTVRDLTLDGAGTLWVATAGGLFRYEGSQWLAFTPSAFPAMNGAAIKSLSRGPASDFAVAPARGVTRGPTYVGLGNLPPGMPGGVVRISGLTVEAVTDSAGTPLIGPHWVSAVPGGAWAGRQSGGVISRIVGLAATKTYPTPDGQDLFSILGREDGTAWAGTRQTLAHFDRTSWSIYPLPGFAPAKITAIAVDSTEGVWIGTDSKGAGRIDPLSGVLTPLAGLPSNAVNAIHVAANHDVWIATVAGAARVVNGAVSDLLTVAQGLPNNIVLSIGTDQAGRVWVGTTNGVVYLEPGAAAVYNTGDGLQTSSVTAMLADTSEALLGSDSNGLALFHRDNLPPRVALTDVPSAVFASRTARVDFTGGDLSSDNAQVQFSWRLNGQVRVPFSTDKTARLLGLADDIYTIEVLGRDRALNVTPSPAAFTFEVDATPPQPRLARPTFDAVVRGTTPIVPIVAEPRFASWKLDFRPAGEEDPIKNPWHVVINAATLPPDTLLWDTTPYLDGVYELRLSVTDTLGLTGYAIVNTTIDNLSPGDAVTSPARIDNNTGGRVFTLNAEVELYFPPHALDGNPIITIDTLGVPGQLPPGASSILSAWHVTPTGLETHKPVTLTIELGAQAAIGDQSTGFGVFALAGAGTYSYLGGSLDAASGKLVTTTSRLGDFVVARGLFAGLAGGGRALDIQPRAFSPLGTTFDDRAAISFQLASAEGARIYVYDRSGRLVRRVFDGPLNSGRNVVYWDGRDGNGDTVPSGLYLVTVEAEGKTDVRSVAVVNR